MQPCPLLNINKYRPAESTVNSYKDRQWSLIRINGLYRREKCSLSVLPPPWLLPSSIYSSPTLCRSDEYHPSKSEMQRNLSIVPQPPFSSAYLFLSLHPSSVFPPFLIYFPFLLIAYVDLILSHYDDLRFSFSCWPIKTKQQRQWEQPSLLLQTCSS